MTPLLNFSAGSISLIPRSTFKNTKKDIQLNKCNFRRTALLLPHPTFPLNWISTRSISKTRILTSAVEADVAVEADPNPKPETSEQAEPLSEQTEEAASTTPAVKVKQARPGMKSKLPPVNKEDLVPGATFTGVVRSIQPFGLFVDVGAFTDGLVHISQISSDYIKDVKALFTVGQEVEVRLLEYNVQSGRISLTMRAPGDEKKEGSSGGTDTARGRGGRTRQDKRRPKYLEGNVCSGKVTKITEEGAVVNFPGEVEGFLPVSEQVVVEGSEGGATLEVDQEIEVRILSVIKGEITLTMKEDGDVDKALLESLEKKKGAQAQVSSKKKKGAKGTFKVEIDREFDALEQMGVEYEEEGEEGGNDAEVLDQAALENSGFDVDDGTMLVNPFVSTFLRSRYAANAEKRLELIGAVKKAGSVVAVSTASVSEVAGGEVAVAGDGSEVGSVSIAEEQVALTEVEGGEAAVGTASTADEPVAAAGVASEVSASEVVSDSTVAETSSVATDSTTEASVAEPLVAGTSEAEEGEVAAAEAVPEVSKSEVSSEIGSVSVAEEPVVVSEVEESEVTAAEVVPEVAESEVASESTVTEASTGSTDLTAGAPPADEPASVTSEVTSEVEKSEVTAAEAVPEVSESEVASEPTVTEASTGTTDLTTETPPADEAGSVTSEVTSEVEKSEVTAAEAVLEVSKSEVASEPTVTEASTGTTDLTTETPPADEAGSVTSEVTSEVEKSEVTAAEAVPEVSESEVASEPTVTEASTGTTDLTTETPPADEAGSVTSENLVSDSQTVLSESGASEIAASGKTEEDASNKTEEAVSINVADEKTEVSEATPEASPTQAHEVKATISPSLVKQLRDETGAGMMDCKKALAETNGDLATAQEYLRKKGLASADKRASRATAEGRIGSYVHDGRIGVLIEVNCETDFVSRGDIFKELVEDIAMQVAACPQVTYLTSDEVPEETVQKEKEIEMQREDILSKPENIREKIVEGRIRKRLEEFALLEQPFIKDDKVVVKDYVKQKIATIGENIKVKRFVRFNLGEGLEKKSQDFAAEVAAQTASKPAATAEVAAAPPKDEKVETIETEEKAPAATVTISPALVKALREETGAGMMDCKKALAETGGDIEKAQEFLRKKGLSSADKKSSRLAAEGLISAYIHDARIGCLIEVNSETDFVARNENFKELVNDLAMQVVACPQVEYVSVDEVPASVVEKEKAIEMGREDLQSKPEQIREKIVEGRISKRLGELALLEQPFIKDDSITVKELVKRTIASLGENIKVRRFVRFTLGESTD